MEIKCPKCFFNNPDDTLYCGNCVEVSFSHIITGVSKKDGIKQVLLDGTTTWEMQKQIDTWKITDINFRRTKKK